MSVQRKIPLPSSSRSSNQYPRQIFGQTSCQGLSTSPSLPYNLPNGMFPLPNSLFGSTGVSVPQGNYPFNFPYGLSIPPPSSYYSQSTLFISRQWAVGDDKSDAPSDTPVSGPHVLVKNAPFNMQVGIKPETSDDDKPNFSLLKFDVDLLYDNEQNSMDKLVDFVKVRPIQHKVKIAETNDEALIEVRIKVLTSQHENSLFRVRITAMNTNGEFAPLVTFSDPIKVISKPEQTKKPSAPKKRLNPDHNLEEIISRIEEQQQQQQDVILKLIEQQTVGRQILENSQKLIETYIVKHGLPTQPKKEDQFVHTFGKFLTSFVKLSDEEKPRKIRKILRSCTLNETNQVFEMVDQLQAQSPPKYEMIEDYFSNFLKNSTGDEQQKQNCPYQKELERIDEFYKDCLLSPRDDLFSGNLNLSFC